jgi:hypothetical protein
MRSHREEGSRHERGQAVAAGAPDQELRAEPGDDGAHEQCQVVAEDRTAQQRGRGGQDRGQEQVLREGQRVGQRVEDRRLEEPARRVQQRVRVPGQDPGVEAAVGPVGHSGSGEVEDEGPTHHHDQQRVSYDRPADLPSVHRSW